MTHLPDEFAIALMDEAREPLDLRTALPILEGDGWRRRLRRWLDGILGLPAVRRGFQDAMKQPGRSFSRACLSFRLKPAITDLPLPATGPVIIMANHPFGGADALVLASACLRVRPDCLLLANEMVAHLPGLEDDVIPLSILGGEDAQRKNAAALKKALRHLKNGGALSVFPAGEVARWRGGGVEEGAWSSHIAALALKSRATIVPVRFFGQNPAWFHLIGGVHPLVRTAFIPRVLLGAHRQPVRMKAGEWLEAPDPTDQRPREFAAFLRGLTLAIQED